MHRAEIGVRRVKVAEGGGEGRKDWAACWNPALRASPVDWIPVGSRDNWLTSSVWSAISSSGERDCSAKFCARYKVCGLAETVVRPPRPPLFQFPRIVRFPLPLLDAAFFPSFSFHDLCTFFYVRDDSLRSIFERTRIGEEEGWWIISVLLFFLNVKLLSFLASASTWEKEITKYLQRLEIVAFPVPIETFTPSLECNRAKYTSGGLERRKSVMETDLITGHPNIGGHKNQH